MFLVDSSHPALFPPCFYFYNNKIMFAAPPNRQIPPSPPSEPRPMKPPFTPLSEQSKSINFLLSDKQAANENDSQLMEQLDGKIKKYSPLPSLFSSNDFLSSQSPSSARETGSHSSYLQILRNLPRRTHEQSNIKVMLKTEYSVIHNLIHKYFNYKFYNKEDQYNDIFLMWVDTYVSEEFIKRLKSYQKINHFPSSCELGRKDLLAVNLNQARAHMPELYQFYPETWVLPRDFQAFNQRESSSFYIIKPHANCQGRGIYLSKNPPLTSKDEVVIQEYIENPMLIDGSKFDLRVYVLVRSLDPLRIYVYEEGLCRLATSTYSKPNEGNFRNDKMHLTNYAINKFAPNFIGNRDIKEDNRGHKRSLTSAMKTLESLGFDPSKIQERIDSIIIRTVLSAYTKMLQSYKKSRESNISFKYLKEFMNYKEEGHKYFSSDNSKEESVCFQLFGFDIILLETGEPILLEVNHQPSLVTDSPLDLNTKRCLVMDTINILNIDESDRELWAKCQAEGSTFKHKHLEEKELEVAGGYRRIYPLTHIKLHEKSEQESQRIQKYIELYEGMLNRIMFRQFKRLSKLKMVNYRTITSRHKPHLSKYNQDDNRVNLSAPRTADKSKNSKYQNQNQKSVALTFYNLFNNSKYLITRGNRSPERESESELEEKIIKNHILLESIEKDHSKQRKRASKQEMPIRPLHLQDELIDLKPKSRREEFYLRKQQAIANRLPDFFVDREHKRRDVSFQEPKLSQVDKAPKHIRWNIHSSKNKGTIHYISTNKSKKLLKDAEDDARQTSPFSSVNKNNLSNFISEKSYPKTKDTSKADPEAIPTTKQRLQSQTASNHRTIEYRQIYGNSIKQKIQRINNLKAIKNNLHKLNFINFVQRTKCVRQAITSNECLPSKESPHSNAS